MKVEVEIISKELIKPSSPTPPHLRHLQLSFLDQVQAPVCMPFVLFYSKDPNFSNSERCIKLKTSLSKALTAYYPLAGRVDNNDYVDCNDEGALFVEAQANIPLSHILSVSTKFHKVHPWYDAMSNKKFLPLQPDEGKDFAAFYQITFFTCGGLAISMALSHKLGDGLSKIIFLNHWAVITRQSNSDVLTKIPPFGLATLFPPKKLGFDPRDGIIKDNIVTKRFVFDASVLSYLKSKYSENNGGTPSRVEALSAFIWSRFMAATQPNETSNKLYLVLHAVNLRPRMEPPLSNQHFGNISRIATMALANQDGFITNENQDVFMSRMKDSIKNVNADYVKSLQKSDEHLNFLKEGTEKVTKGEMIHFGFTSLCNFPAYEIDFGWGKAEWVASAPVPFKNLVIMLDTSDGKGIEAWITLEEENMAKFDIDKELLAHVSSSILRSRF
ncbi:stemmadenine O-acetyltransferase-like [Mercurialis annua]|uniref:stemmadenine O-acetyltransferase-like n=1 Tax=Mercurialis annua TaxID=3986 RepID=UPI0024ACB164|nr:stemmadenine O-acetyltransferase-like [Mercurialis annua]